MTKERNGTKGNMVIHPLEDVRLVHLINRAQVRGAENVATDLHARLKPKVRSSQLIALRPGDMVPRTDIDSILVGKSALGWIAGLKKLRGISSGSNGPTIVIAHGASSALAACVAAAFLSDRDRPCIIWHRILRLPGSVRSIRYAPHRWVAARVDGVIAITKYLLDETRALGFGGCGTVIPNHRPMTSVPPYRETSRRGPPMVLFAGSLTRQKRPEVVLDLARMAMKEEFPVLFRLAGDGPMMGELKKHLQADSDLASCVRLDGHVTQLSSLFFEASCLILPSANESSPGVVIEAMMHGCPVVAFSVDGIDEIVGVKGGVVVPSGDVERLWEALKQMISEGRPSSERALLALDSTRFATEHVVEEYERLFEAALVQRKTRAQVSKRC